MWENLTAAETEVEELGHRLAPALRGVIGEGPVELRGIEDSEGTT
ncbi:MAG TPA: hypothetical protein VGM05_10490 [Planctomycetaceae bacterium]